MLVYNRIKSAINGDNLVSIQSPPKQTKSKLKTKALLRENKLFLKSIGLKLKKEQ